MKVTHLSINDTTITATISHEGTEVEYEFGRDGFERWLCGDNHGIVDMSFEAEGQHVPLIQTLEEYWILATEINDTDAKTQMGQYIEQEEMVLFELSYLHTKLMDAIAAVPDRQHRLNIRAALMVYSDARYNLYMGANAKEVGNG